VLTAILILHSRRELAQADIQAHGDVLETDERREEGLKSMSFR
jgi:hypothetical protein